MKRFTLHNTALLFAVSPLLVIGCKGETSTPEVEILEVRVSPGEVQAGYISELVCVFSDSLSDKYQFKWTMETIDGTEIDTITNTRTFFYQSPNAPGTYSNSVQVLYKEKELTEPYSFEVSVVENEWIPSDPFYNDADLLYSDDQHIFLMNSETGKEREIAIGWLATWSPEGDRIAFMDFDQEASADQVYIMNADGTGKQLVSYRDYSGELRASYSPSTYPVWSPDGRKIAYSQCVACTNGGSNYDVIITEIDTTDGLKQFRVTTSIQYDRVSDWSNDGQRLLIFSRERLNKTVDEFGNMFEIRTNGTEKSLIIEFEGNFRNGYYKYSKSEEQIILTGRGDNELNDIYTLNRDGSGFSNITNTSDLYETNVSWGKTDQSLLVVLGSGIKFPPDRRDHIFIYSIDGSQQVQLTQTARAYSRVEWRPNRN